MNTMSAIRGLLSNMQIVYEGPDVAFAVDLVTFFDSLPPAIEMWPDGYEFYSVGSDGEGTLHKYLPRKGLYSWSLTPECVGYGTHTMKVGVPWQDCLWCKIGDRVEPIELYSVEPDAISETRTYTLERHPLLYFAKEARHGGIISISALIARADGQLACEQDVSDFLKLYGANTTASVTTNIIIARQIKGVII